MAVTNKKIAPKRAASFICSINLCICSGLIGQGDLFLTTHKSLLKNWNILIESDGNFPHHLSLGLHIGMIG